MLLVSLVTGTQVVHIYTCRQNTHTHKNKGKTFKKDSSPKFHTDVASGKEFDVCDLLSTHEVNDEIKETKWYKSVCHGESSGICLQLF